MSDLQPGAHRDKVGYGAILKFVMRNWLTQPRPLAGLLIGVAIMTGCDIMTPVAAGWLVSAIAPAHGVALLDRGLALHAALWAVGVIAVVGFLSIVGRRAMYIGMTRLTSRVMSSALVKAFDRVQHFSTDWHANTFAGSTVRRLTRGMWALDTVNDVLLLALLPQFFVVLGTAAVLSYRDRLMGIALFVSIALMITLTVLLTIYYVSPASRVSNRSDSKVGAAIADAITCNATVKSFGAEMRENARLNAVLRTWRHLLVVSWTRGTDSGNIQAAASLCMRLILIGIVTWRWWEGQADAGQVAYVLTMVFLIQGYMRDLGHQIDQLQRGVNEMEEMVAIYSHETDVMDTPHAHDMAITKGAITFENVTFNYPGSARALFKEFSVLIAPGTRVALVGRSGSGKSSFVKLLQRLYDPQQGCVRIDGVDLREMKLAGLRSQIAIVPQDPALFHRSLAENISYGNPSATFEQIQEAARQANADDFIKKLPKGYETLVGERGVKLSGGERQRVAIARAFLADAPLVIFDEATSSLDSQSELLVKEAMDRLMKNRTVIVIAHRLSTVRELDRIIVFKHGHIIEDGTHDALLELEGGTYQHLYRIQAEGGQPVEL